MLAIAGEAAAHTSFEGAEGFYRGLFHPVAEPLQGLLAAAFGTVAARCRRDDAGRAVALALAAAIAGALIKGLTLPDTPVSTLALSGAALACGLSLAAFRKIPGALALGLATLTGAVTGVNAVSAGDAGRVATSIGSLSGASLMVIYLLGAGSWLTKQEARHDGLQIAPRVAGAWIGAIAIMILAFELAGAAAP